jgi:hypothetical protein
MTTPQSSLTAIASAVSGPRGHSPTLLQLFNVAGRAQFCELCSTISHRRGNADLELY